MKRVTLFLMTLALLLMVAACQKTQLETETAADSTELSQSERETRMREWARLTAEQIRSEESEDHDDLLAVEAKDFSKTETALEFKIRELMITGASESEARARVLDFIVKDSLYYAAKESGMDFDESEAIAHHAEQRRMLEAALADPEQSDGAYDMKIYFEALAEEGVSLEAYWANAQDLWVRNEWVAAYTQSLHDSYLAQGSSAEDVEAYEQFCFEMTREAVKAQGLKLHGVKWTLTQENYQQSLWPEL